MHFIAILKAKEILSDPSVQLEGGDSSIGAGNRLGPHFQVNQHNVWHTLPKVDLNKFDGSDLAGWFTQMEHYFSLQGIIGESMNLEWMCYTWTGRIDNGGNGIRSPMQGTLLDLVYEGHLCSL